MDECIKVRRTGRSTGKALAYISNAYNSPGSEFPVYDHYPMQNNHMASRNMVTLIKSMVEDLGLKGFVFNKSENMISYLGLCNCEVIERSKIEFPCGCKECGKAKT